MTLSISQNKINFKLCALISYYEFINTNARTFPGTEPHSPTLKGSMQIPSKAPSTPGGARKATAWWRSWWRSQAPHRQDRYAVLAPLGSGLAVPCGHHCRVLPICDSRKSTANKRPSRRDVEYAQQRLRLRLLERQEQLMRIRA
jgi:hypothetical protein